MIKIGNNKVIPVGLAKVLFGSNIVWKPSAGYEKQYRELNCVKLTQNNSTASGSGFRLDPYTSYHPDENGKSFEIDWGYSGLNSSSKVYALRRGDNTAANISLVRFETNSSNQRIPLRYYYNGSTVYLDSFLPSTRYEGRFKFTQGMDNNNVYVKINDTVVLTAENQSGGWQSTPTDAGQYFYALFGRVDCPDSSNVALYSLKTYQTVNGSKVLTHDWKPAQRKSDNVIGFYDTITSLFIQSSGGIQGISYDSIVSENPSWSPDAPVIYERYDFSTYLEVPAGEYILVKENVNKAFAPLIAGQDQTITIDNNKIYIDPAINNKVKLTITKLRGSYDSSVYYVQAGNNKYLSNASGNLQDSPLELGMGNQGSGELDIHLTTQTNYGLTRVAGVWNWQTLPVSGTLYKKVS